MVGAEEEDDEGDGTITYPVEFVIFDTPLSLQASGSSKDDWKDKVKSAAKAVLPKFFMLEDKPLAAQIIYFAPDVMEGDIDNIVKPILDALGGVAYKDDGSLEAVAVQKIEPGVIVEFVSPTPTLLEAIDGDPPAVYIRVWDDLSWRVLP